LRGPVFGGDSALDRALAKAARLAVAYAAAWSDSFYVRQLTRLRALSIADRHATITADTPLQVGEIELRRSGPQTAMRAWRESLRRFEALHDTAGIAASLGSLAKGLAYLEQLDSAEVYFRRALDYAERIGDNA